MSHTPRESAIYLLNIFRENECEPDEYLYAAIFAYPFTQEDWTTLDFHAGLAFAIEQGWAKQGMMDRVCATAEGLTQN